MKLQIFEAISTIRKNSKRPYSKAIQDYIINNSASNINESFVLDTLLILVDQNILNKPLQSVSERNKCMYSSSHALCYGRVQSCVIHNSFASHGRDVIYACRANKAECQ